MRDKHETLGRSVIPSNYKLEMEPGLTDFRFKGRVVIKATARKSTRLILLNAKELRIRRAAVRWNGGEQKAKVSMDLKKERMALRLHEAVRGPIEIEVSYEGKHNDKLYGFYRSAYTHKKKTDYIFTTQFEAADARAALPCFDEPEFKATFDVSLLIHKKLDAISNNEIKAVTDSGRSKKLVTFETSPKMSTYLLYLGVGRFEYLGGKHGKLKLRIVTTPGKAQQGTIALAYVKKIVDFYERYFGIRYPLRKLDLIAVPDFSVGAMENWGAITFRETELLWEEDTGSVLSKMEVFSVIAHEMAHQWFGDLVTMAWWDDIWLNESFASFMGRKCEDLLNPRWDARAQDIMDHRTGLGIALQVDQMKATHPISDTVERVADIYRIFDRLSYSKGSNFLGMLEDYVGETTFKQGLHTYLKRHAYANATKQDLWNALEAAARRRGKGLRVREVAKDWLEKEGYPIVTVYKTDWAVHLSQRRYTLTEKPADKKERWTIPLHYVTDKGLEGRALMHRTDMDIGVDSALWVKLNYAEKGVYRVRYEGGLLQTLGEAIVGGKLNGIDAWGIENDLFALVRSGRAGLSEYLSFVDTYCANPRYPMNRSISEHLGWLRNMCEGLKCEKGVLKTSLNYHLGLIKTLGWRARKNDISSDSIMRSRIVSELVALGHQHAVKMVEQLFRDYRRNRDSIDPNMIQTVLVSVAWGGGAKEYRTLLKMYETETSVEIKEKLLNSLGFFHDEKLTRKALAYSMTKKVRLQDAYSIPLMISGTETNAPSRMMFGTGTARRTLLSWTMKNWKHFMSVYAPGIDMLSRYVRNLMSNRDEGSLRKIASFFSNKKNRRKDIENPIGQVEEEVMANINFIKKNQG